MPKPPSRPSLPASGSSGRAPSSAAGPTRSSRFCVDGCGGGNSGAYLFEGGEFYGAFGRPTAHMRWQTTFDLLYGAGQSSNPGTIYAARAVTGFRFLSNPTDEASFVLELNGGLSYYGVGSPGASAPMVGGSLRLGVDVNSVEILGAASVDTILAAGAASATIPLGYAFDR